MTGSTFEDVYSLPRDKAESIRLEAQHRMIIKNAGFVLHPNIAANLPENARIADIATGTGIWMKDAAATAPSGWSFTGFDLSDAQFPPPDQREGRAFELLNILEPLPKHLENTFDAVHIRYLICALSSSEDWLTVAQNLLKLLKPGGYLQWFESDFPRLKVLQSDPRNGMEAATALTQAFITLQWEGDPARLDAVSPNLKRHVEKAGLQDVREDVIASDREAETRKETTLIGYKALSAGAVYGINKRGGWVHDEQWVDETRKKAVEEAEGGVYVRWDMHVITARKPK